MSNIAVYTSEEKTKALLDAHFDNIKAYMDSVGRYEPLFLLMKADVEGDISLLSALNANLDIDFFIMDIDYRPQLYNLIENSALLLQEYFIDNPVKDSEEIKSV